MPAMSPCTCAAAGLTAVRFVQDVVLLRCTHHEQQAWTVDGRPATAAQAHAVLREAFEDGRTRRGARRAAPRERVVQLVSSPATPAEALTALLNARGLVGSWSVASAG